MKKYIFLLFVLFLPSCIIVDDSGGYWTKGVLDSALEGHWKRISPVSSEGGAITPGECIFTKKDNNYELTEFPEWSDARGKSTYYARTLHLGIYTFLLTGKPSIFKWGRPERNAMIRYVSIDRGIKQYKLDATAAYEFFKQRSPDHQPIGISKTNESPEHFSGWLWIQKLTEDNAKILSEIPDTGAYWLLQAEYAKVP